MSVTIVTVAGKGSPLNATEFDANVTNLKNAVEALQTSAPQNLRTTDSPTFVSIKLSNLTDGYIPYHQSDANGLANGPLFTDGTSIVIGHTTPNGKLDVWDGNITLSGTDVDHGMTGQAATSVFAKFAIYSGSGGGLDIRALSDNDATALSVLGVMGATNPTDTTPAVQFIAAKKNTIDPQSLGASETAYQFKNWSEVLITVLGNGNTGFGTITPQQPVHAVGTTPIRFERVGVASYDIFLSAFGSDVNDFMIQPQNNSTGFGFGVKDDAGNLVYALTGTKDGVIGITKGQLKFPASQNASSDANTLDDYEEGEWTPSVGGNATYTLQTGKYIKIGRQITIWGQLTINVLGTGSTALISGAPFTALGLNGGGVVEFYAGMAINFYSACLDIDNDGTVIWLNVQAALDANIDVQAAVFGNGASCRFKMTYLSVS